ncbi:hypothetical protein FB451DRAFT_1121523 [Mycena latifolia]|nr:hypothetical protein FB451DRAFT_1121523 [Mycena latifolia]
MASKRGLVLYVEAETHYEAGRVTEAFDLYRQTIVQILDHEDVLQKIPGIPEQFPQELIAAVWQNLVVCFRESHRKFTQGKLSRLFEEQGDNTVYNHPREHINSFILSFKGPEGKRLLKAMQIPAAFALAILAWNKGDRSTAAKRYQEALDVAATHPPFNAVTPGLKHLDKISAGEVQQIRENLATLREQGAFNTARAGSSQGGLRKDVLNVPHAQLEDGVIIPQQGLFVVATDACGRVGCTKRGVNFKRCNACKKTVYCSVECQKEDWKKHKTTHTGN